MDGLLGQRDSAKREMDELGRQLREAGTAAADERMRQAAARDTRQTGIQPPDFGRRTASLHVGRNERTYRPDQDPKGTGFLRDVGLAHMHGPSSAAGRRLARHMDEEEAERGGGLLERASGIGNLPGLVIPQYLADMYGPAARAMRPFADACNHHDLPRRACRSTCPSRSTPATAALQTSENTAVSQANAATTLITENVQTAAGALTLSCQAIDRGTGVDQVFMQDLFNAVATNLDSTLINQATMGLSAFSTVVTTPARARRRLSSGRSS